MSAESLAARQEELVRALTGQGPAPPGFDAQRIGAVTVSLVRKRIRTVARVWPDLAAALGKQFENQFTAYAHTTPLPADGSPRSDAYAFAQLLDERGELPQQARLDLLIMAIRNRWTTAGLVPRCLPVVKAAMLRDPRRLVLGVGLSWAARWWTIPLAKATKATEQ